jgi:hypothetical protein
MRYTRCIVSGGPGVTPKRCSPHDVESDVFSCDYNGWADVPEEEREGIDAFEAALPLNPAGAIPPSIVEPLVRQVLPVRWSADSAPRYRRAA